MSGTEQATPPVAEGLATPALSATRAKQRILFMPQRVGVHSTMGKFGVGRVTGMVLSAANTIGEVRAETGPVAPNPGNMIHVEATAKTFDVDRSFSCFGGWPLDLTGQSDEALLAACERIDERFDGVVFSFANIIKDYRTTDARVLEMRRRNFSHLCRWFANLKRPLYIFGIGLQDVPDPEHIWPPLLELLSVVNRHAALFAVRGIETEQWLHQQGFGNARALGCPSLFAYPHNVLGIEPPDPSAPLRYATAGRLDRTARGRESLPFLRRMSEETAADYVFQNDLFGLSVARFEGPRRVFDDASGELDRTHVNELVAQHLKWPDPRFRAYYYFRDPNRWRMFAHLRDIYVGDRFHGGVVFLQSRRPALFVYGDRRVQELTSFFDLPAVSWQDMAARPIAESVAEHLDAGRLDRMKATYRRRLGDYVAACEGAGLEFLGRDLLQELLDG